MQLDDTEVRVVGGENMMEERPTTEGLELFDTGVEVRHWLAASKHTPAVHWSCSVHVVQSLPYCIRTPHSVALRLQPIDEPPPAAAARTADSQKQSGEGNKGKAQREEPYAEDVEDAEEQGTDSSRNSMWGWLKGLGGAGQQTSAKQVHEVSRETHFQILILACQAGLRQERLG